MKAINFDYVSNWDTKKAQHKTITLKNALTFVQASFVEHYCRAVLIRFWESKTGESQGWVKRAINPFFFPFKLATIGLRWALRGYWGNLRNSLDASTWTLCSNFSKYIQGIFCS